MGTDSNLVAPAGLIGANRVAVPVHINHGDDNIFKHNVSNLGQMIIGLNADHLDKEGKMTTLINNFKNYGSETTKYCYSQFPIFGVCLLIRVIFRATRYALRNTHYIFYTTLKP